MAETYRPGNGYACDTRRHFIARPAASQFASVLTEQRCKLHCQPLFFGAGEWLGLVPQGTRQVTIVLSDGCAAADFNLASCEILSFQEVVSFARGRSAGKALLAAGLGAVGLRGDASGILEDILGATPLERYHEWRALNGRDLDLAGLDARRDSWRQGPHIRVIIHAIDEKTAEGVDTTFASLQRQTYPNWSLALVGAEMTYRGDRQAFRVEADARAGLLRACDGLRLWRRCGSPT